MYKQEEKLMGFFVALIFIMAIVSGIIGTKVGSRTRSDTNALMQIKVKTEDNIYETNKKLDELSAVVSNKNSSAFSIEKKINEYLASLKTTRELVEDYQRASNIAYASLNKQRMVANGYGGRNDLYAISYFANESKYVKSGLNISLKDGSITLARAYEVLNRK